MRIVTKLLGRLACVGLAACGSGDDPDRQASEVVVALENAPIHLDPRVGTDQASSRIYELTMNGLVTKSPKGDLLPSLAKSWEILEDGSLYRFRLREGVHFSDGTSFDAADVVWTFQSILDGTVTTAKKGAFAQLDRVEAVDTHTVDFHMKEPFGAMLVNLTSYLGIVPDGRMPDEQNRTPIGTGPFQVAERDPERVVLQAFDGAWEGRPRLDRVVFRAVPDPTVRALELRKGSVQLVINGLAADVVPSFRENQDFQVIEDPGSNYAYLGINFEDEILAERGVRRAIAMAIDRRTIVETLWRGLGVLTETAMPPGHWARNENLELISYDPARARHLLDESGYLDPDGDGPQPRLALTYKTSTDETALLQAQTIQAMLGKVGIEIEIRSYEFATFYSDIKQGDFQLFSLVWTGILDPDFYSLIFHSERVPPDGSNRGRYRNQEVDRLLEAGARGVRPQDRLPHYLRAQEIFADELPYVSLFTKVNVAVMPRGLDGYENYLAGEVYSLKKMEWTTAGE